MCYFLGKNEITLIGIHFEHFHNTCPECNFCSTQALAFDGPNHIVTFPRQHGTFFFIYPIDRLEAAALCRRVRNETKRKDIAADMVSKFAIGMVESLVRLRHSERLQKWVQTPCVRQVDKPGTPVAAARGSRSCTPTMGGIPGSLARVYHPPSSQQTPPQGYQGLPSRGNEPPQSPSPYSNLPYARPSMVIHDPVTP